MHKNEVKPILNTLPRNGLLLFMRKIFDSKLKIEIITKYFERYASLGVLSKEYNIPRTTIYEYRNAEDKDYYYDY